MSDGEDRRVEVRRETDELGESRDLRKAWDDQATRKELERLKAQYREHPERGSRPEDELARLERISERDSMRHLPDFDPEKVRAAEAMTLGAGGAEADVRRRLGEGLDPATERDIGRKADQEERERQEKARNEQRRLEIQRR